MNGVCLLAAVATSRHLVVWATAALAVLLLAASAPTATGAATSDEQIRAAVREAFYQLRAGINAQIKCDGCDAAATTVQGVSKRCFKSLNSIRYYTTQRGNLGSQKAFEACRYYGLFAGDYALSYLAAQRGDEQGAQDYFTTAKSELSQARTYARQAGNLLGLSVLP
jgi:hypothetical protein